MQLDNVDAEHLLVKAQYWMHLRSPACQSCSVSQRNWGVGPIACCHITVNSCTLLQWLDGDAGITGFWAERIHHSFACNWCFWDSAAVVWNSLPCSSLSFPQYGEDDFCCWSTADKLTPLFRQHRVAVEQLLLGNASGQVNCYYSELHSIFVWTTITVDKWQHVQVF